MIKRLKDDRNEFLQYWNMGRRRGNIGRGGERKFRGDVTVRVTTSYLLRHALRKKRRRPARAAREDEGNSTERGTNRP